MINKILVTSVIILSYILVVGQSVSPGSTGPTGATGPTAGKIPKTACLIYNLRSGATGVAGSIDEMKNYLKGIKDSRNTYARHVAPAIQDRKGTFKVLHSIKKMQTQLRKLDKIRDLTEDQIQKRGELTKAIDENQAKIGMRGKSDFRILKKQYKSQIDNTNGRSAEINGLARLSGILSKEDQRRKLRRIHDTPASIKQKIRKIDDERLTNARHEPTAEEKTQALSKAASIANVDLTGINIATISEGLSEFVIDRAKTDLTTSFFQALQGFLNKNPEAKTLFPNTLQTIQGIAAIQYNEFLPTLRQAFYSDLNNLPDDIASVLTLPRYQHLLASFPEIRVALKSLLIVSKLHNPDFHPAEMIHMLATIPDYNDTLASLFLRDYGATWKLAGIISNLLVNPNTKDYYALDSMETMIEDPVKVNEILLLLCKEVKDSDLIFFLENGTPVHVDSLDFFVFYEDNSVAFKTFLQNAVQSAQQISASTTQYKAAATQSDKKAAIISYMDASVNTVTTLLNFCNLIDNNLNTQPYVEMVRDVVKIPDDAIKEDYGSLVSDAIGFLSDILQMASENANKQELKVKAGVGQKKLLPVTMKPIKILNKSLPVVVTANNLLHKQLSSVQNDAVAIYATKSIAGGVHSFDTINAGLKVISKILKIANMAANVVTAKTSDAVKQAIENAALPPGSSSIKKNSPFNVSLQMHLGAAYNLRNFGTNAPNSWSSAFNVTLPVGVSINTGFKKGGCLGLFISVIDIGAIAQYELLKDTGSNTSLKEKIQIQDIFSPGAYISYGFPCNIPLSLNFGGQYGPGLTHVTNTALTTGNPTGKLVLSLTYDLPAFTIINSAKQKTKQLKFSF